MWPDNVCPPCGWPNGTAEYVSAADHPLGGCSGCLPLPCRELIFTNWDFNPVYLLPDSILISNKDRKIESELCNLYLSITIATVKTSLSGQVQANYS